MISIILSTVARLLLPLMLVFSLFLLVRGHNEPGGGFVGGLVAAAAFGLYAIAFDAATARRSLRFDPHMIVGVGLVIAVVAGLWGLFAGQNFLTGQWAALELGLFEIDLGTPVLFDVGVYLVVLGVTVGVILWLAEEE